MRYFLGLLVTIGLIVFILILVFSGGGGSKTTVKPIYLPDYADTTARAQLIIDGPEISEEQHQSVEIDVTRDQVAITIFKGYQRTLVNTQNYPNNKNAFDTFLRGLQNGGYTLGLTNSKLGDERGHCVSGTRDIYTFNDGSKDLFRYWSTSCKQGTFKGNIATMIYLFQNQVPDYDDLTADLNL